MFHAEDCNHNAEGNYVIAPHGEMLPKLDVIHLPKQFYQEPKASNYDYTCNKLKCI